jgi:hypothetical protein
VNEAMENVVVRETLRGRCAPAHLPCQDRVVDNVTPVPALVPGDFTVRLGDVMPGWVMEGLEAEFGKYEGITEAVSGFLSWMHWVEMEAQGYDDLLEGLARLKGALMAAATPAVGEW